ncbi:hypothetical protein GWK47_014565 [Chionoecetes opilio]|uniref:THAP-type domain-containing protein n=1 Tax=Chionoecetes opilio TaxID=41210 RepID=A0A8J4XVU1_CHIOP|nr:hypothetical protein GWK47_014565 [Chionoecetes opilio]
MTVFVCAVADCKSDSRKKVEKHPCMVEVKGWVKFPSAKKEPQRRKLWEDRCRRSHGSGGWKATRFHAICSRHFINWIGNGPSSSHPDPKQFAYNDWGKKLSYKRPSNTWQINNVQVTGGSDLVCPAAAYALPQEAVVEVIISENGEEVGPHYSMQQLSSLKATLDLHPDADDVLPKEPAGEVIIIETRDEVGPHNSMQQSSFKTAANTALGGRTRPPSPLRPRDPQTGGAPAPSSGATSLRGPSSSLGSPQR